MIKDFKRRSIQFLLPLFTLAAFVGCNKDISLSLDNSRDETIGVVPIDTVSVKVSTYQLDNIPTSATGTMLVGKNSNAITGSVKSTAYMRLGVGTVSNSSIPDDAVLDSVTLVLTPNKYYYGDTTQVQKVSVHRVLEDITQTQIDLTKPADERPVFVTTASLFSKQKFEYEQSPLAELSFSPRVKSIDSLFFKFNNSISNELFTMIKNNDNRIQNSTSFQEYFKGLALVPDDNNTAMVGFKDTVYLQVHYSFLNNEGTKSVGKQYFSIDNKAFQYNQIESDRSGTKFAPMTLANPQISSKQTDGYAFLEGSTGVVAKIEFPTLLELVNNPSIAINKAELVIEAENGALATFTQPQSLVLMIANNSGNPVSLLTSPYGTTTQQVPLVPGDDFGSNGKYTFNLIEYLAKIKTTAYKNTSLYLSLPTSGLFSSGNRLILAKDNDNDPKIKLNILYTKF
ncbi:DUF4270 family protein [Sphingobacterium sp. N143]|uniref:DUF4270 family protein n=1 Tax=Sphingobacterium sp. N143 TaxID=2746727 RepID=UPI0025775FAA|nr:DUF4270 family protein [Sphingobacterium sp. N143]MDM1293823.1 DUF4270 family protein [Sphingobacterium sp. N143]